MEKIDEPPGDEEPYDDEPIGVEMGGGDPHASDRLMIDSLWTLISTRYDEPFACQGVQIAYERMLIAAMDRIGRICRNDLPDEI